MLDRPTSLTRRGLLAGGLGAAVLTGGCDAVGDALGGEEAGPQGAGTPTAPAADADSRLVEEVGAAVAATGALASATADQVRGLAPIGRRLGRLHEAHAARLGWSGTPEEPPVPRRRAAALRRLLEAERRLEQQLVDAALAAESGALAQVLASMAAAVAQQRAVVR
ncbi:hypothetical protein [Nocardioides sp. SYSU DS0651]|uniref:hypothetical protein n=1 Tax=Nocardioides sp. SYSU DS0651 TaxID=3415955 RepID=UPI003F4C26C8